MDMRSPTAPVEIKGVSKRFVRADDNSAKPAGHAVIKELSLSIAPNEIVALIGRSGCGKTTLLHCLAGLVAPDAGCIQPHGLAAQCAVVFQDHRLLPWASLEQNLLLALRARKTLDRKERLRRVADMLGALDLAAFAKTSPSALSGGMAQRAALGRALLQEPALLLMDEPFASLDALTRADMHDLLLALQARSPRTILFVTHDLEEAVKLADRVVVMAEGRIIEDFPIALPRPRDLDGVEIRTIQRHLRGLVSHRGESTPNSHSINPINGGVSPC
ncbi:ABC transporter ATP-binding protein [Cohaesibacter haloalkalitolerans]|uniref:ABC transporter ATP-binding protein n=1 Tax=Cohaesibacter haloalkalitolerans TaxID=1162980 RepID=UPI000E6480C4|nr:ABC transporter ATP-binding protein [Cohaesibacter haloalkalitolerans]